MPAVVCPKCSYEMSVVEDGAGKTVQCSRCGNFVVTLQVSKQGKASTDQETSLPMLEAQDIGTPSLEIPIEIDSTDTSAPSASAVRTKSGTHAPLGAALFQSVSGEEAQKRKGSGQTADVTTNASSVGQQSAATRPTGGHPLGLIATTETHGAPIEARPRSKQGQPTQDGPAGISYGLLNSLIAISLCALALLGLVASSVGWKLPHALSNLQGLGREVQKPGPIIAEADGVVVTSFRSTLYPNKRGANLMVLFGEIENTTSRPSPRLVVRADIYDHEGQLIQTLRGPVNRRLTPAELNQITSQAVASSLLQRGLDGIDHHVVKTLGSARFSLVLIPPPKDLTNLQYRVALVESTAPTP